MRIKYGERKMSRYFAQLYIDGMHRAGYNEGDNARRQFESYFTECLNDDNYKNITSRAGFDHELFCAAVAQLMTSKYWGCSNDGPYNIKEFFNLSKEQAEFIMDNLPSSLSGLAKGAILACERAEK